MAIRSVARVIRGIPTLEGGGFLVHRPFPTDRCRTSIRFYCSTRWGRWMSDLGKPKALRIIRIAGLKL